MGSQGPDLQADDRCGGNAAPYVLGALTEQEVDSFRLHLTSCAVCREEVAALGIVVDALPSVAPQLSAPSELKQRVMSAVYEDLEQAEGTAPSRSHKLRGSWLEALRWRPALGFASAAAAVVAVVAVVLSSGGGTPTARVIRAQVFAARASASLRLSDGHAELTIADMPQASPDRVYEVWIKRTGPPQATNALFTVSGAGAASVRVPGSVAGAKEILVTSEPLGGSSVPTGPPVIVARLS